MTSKVIKYGPLALLIAQNTLAVIGMRFSRVAEGPMYIVSTAVLTTEVSRVAACRRCLHVCMSACVYVCMCVHVYVCAVCAAAAPGDSS
jgi:hypothetical protein